jgi:hypothetical protein
MARNGYSTTSTTEFPKVGTDGPQLDNVSGQRSPYTERQPRDASAVTAQAPGGPTSHRDQAIINASSGQALADALHAHLVRAQHASEAHLLGCTELGCCARA